MSKIEGDWDIKNLLQTKSAQQNLVNWIQLKVYSEWTTQEKMLDGIMSLKSELIVFSHFGGLSKKWLNISQNTLKLSKVAVYRLLVNE